MIDRSLKTDRDDECDGGPLTKFVDYVTNKDHIRNHEKYLMSRCERGTESGLEAWIKFQYVFGRAFGEGYVGNLKFRVYYDFDTGFELFYVPFTSGLRLERQGETPMVFNTDPNQPGNEKEFIKFLVEHQADRQK